MMKKISERLEKYFENFFEHLDNRANGSFTGPFLVSAILWNWKVLCVLFFAAASMESRLAFLSQKDFGSLSSLKQEHILDLCYFFKFVLIGPGLSALLYVVLIPALNNFALWIKEFSAWVTSPDSLRHRREVSLLKKRLFRAFSDLAKDAPNSESALVPSHMDTHAASMIASGGMKTFTENEVPQAELLVEAGLLVKTGNSMGRNYKFTEDGKLYCESILNLKVDSLD